MPEKAIDMVMKSTILNDTIAIIFKNIQCFKICNGI